MQANVSSTREDVFAKLPIPTALRKMIVPAISSQLIVLIYNMADTFFVGQTDNPYMVAGTSLILPVFNITLCLAGLAGGGGPAGQCLLAVPGACHCSPVCGGHRNFHGACAGDSWRRGKYL